MATVKMGLPCQKDNSCTAEEMQTLQCMAHMCKPEQVQARLFDKQTGTNTMKSRDTECEKDGTRHAHCYEGFYKDETTAGTSKCCPGFFCLDDLVCTFPCSAGGHCPVAVENEKNGQCAPYAYNTDDSQ
jgi:hypothetical protein